MQLVQRVVSQLRENVRKITQVQSKDLDPRVLPVKVITGPKSNNQRAHVARQRRLLKTHFRLRVGRRTGDVEWDGIGRLNEYEREFPKHNGEGYYKVTFLSQSVIAHKNLKYKYGALVLLYEASDREVFDFFGQFLKSTKMNE